MEQFEAINVEQAYTRWKEGSAARSTSAIRKVLKPGIRRRLSSHQRHPVGLYATKRLRAAGDGDVLPRQQQPQRGAVPAAPGFDAVYSIDGGFEAGPVSIRKTWKPLPDPAARRASAGFILCAFSRVFADPFASAQDFDVIIGRQGRRRASRGQNHSLTTEEQWLE